MNHHQRTLFDLEDGDRFEWQGRKYTLLRIDAASDKAYVREDHVDGDQNFNPYARVRPLGDT